MNETEMKRRIAAMKAKRTRELRTPGKRKIPGVLDSTRETIYYTNWRRSTPQQQVVEERAELLLAKDQTARYIELFCRINHLTL